jgi:hypothetical protein
MNLSKLKTPAPCSVILKFGRGSAELTKASLMKAVFFRSFLYSKSSNCERAKAVAAVIIDDDMLVPELYVQV